VLGQPFDLEDGVGAHAANPIFSTGAFQQATWWSGPMSPSGGGSAWQRPSAKGQRGAKRQPLG
jgi:hypothetical protein